MTDRTAAEAIADKVADAGVGLKTAASAVGLADHRAMLHDARKRLNHGYNAMAQAAGVDPMSGEGEEMGDILITGDIHATDPAAVVDSIRKNHKQQQEASQPAPAPPAPPPAVAPPAPAPQNLAKTLAAVGLATAGMGAGVGIPIAAYNLTKGGEQQQQEFVDTDTAYSVRVFRDNSGDSGQ